jgi:DNA-binding Lrp family transcriptional regulator
MNWKQWLLKGMSESALKAFFGAIVASLAGAVVIVYGWVPERALGGLQLLEIGLLFLILAVLAFLFLSQNQLSRERREHLERERRELEIEHDRREQRERALLQFLSQTGSYPDLGGRAYILLKVRPSKSGPVARAKSAVATVQYAIGVWGEWDVIIRVETSSPSRLIAFLTTLQNDLDVERTETLVIRSDQDEAKHNANDGRWGILLLRLGAAQTGEALKILKEASQSPDGIKIPGTEETIPARELKVQHAVGVLGQYDIALTIRYANDESLAKFVMRYIQEGLKAESTTMPAIRGMTYVEGNLSD